MRPNETLESVVSPDESRQCWECRLGPRAALSGLKQSDRSGRTIVGGLQLDENSIPLFPDLGPTAAWAEPNLTKVANQARQLFHASMGVAIGPVPDSAVPSQSFRVAITDGRSSWVPELSCAGHPAIRAIRATKGILNFLRLRC
jgi:hypothetical protein